MRREYLVGTSGWIYDHWEGRFYPRGLRREEWLDFYARSFSTVEVNYSFYRWPSAKTVLNWRDASPHDFSFTLKAPRTITHVRKLRNVGRQVRDFYSLTALLGDKAGCHLFQLPPFIKATPKNIEKLRRFLMLLDPARDNAIEFRDEGWWNDGIYNMLRERNVAFCTVSGLGAPDNVVVSADMAYFRFHGMNYSGCYTPLQMKSYAEKMKGLHCRRVYAYFNNDDRAYAVKNALQLLAFL